MNEDDSRRLLGALLRQRFDAFAERCFAEVNPGQAFLPNWHMNAIAWQLERVARGEIRRLLITLPPRSLKSISASVAFPAWLLGHDPSKRIVCVSYALDLAVAHSGSFRKIVASPWYKRTFPAMRIDTSKDTETETRSRAGGYRLTTTTGGSLTGRGGSVIVIDDPMKAADAHSEAALTRVKTWFDETLLSRIDEKATGAIVVVMQRLHVDDLAGHVLRQGGWYHLDLPAIADDAMRVQIGAGQFYERKRGELLHPAREDLKALEELKCAMGSQAFSAQYQQQPLPLGGNMIKWDWFGVYDQAPSPRSLGAKTIQSWDTASKSHELADYSVGITAILKGGVFHIVEVIRARLDYPALKRRIIEAAHRWAPDALLIEDKGSGTSLIQDLKDDQLRAIQITPVADKVVRMFACSAQIESGHVLLPRSAPWLADFKSEMLAFPNGRHDDQADALSQMINWERTRSRYTLDNVS